MVSFDTGQLLTNCTITHHELTEIRNFYVWFPVYSEYKTKIKICAQQMQTHVILCKNILYMFQLVSSFVIINTLWIFRVIINHENSFIHTFSNKSLLFTSTHTHKFTTYNNKCTNLWLAIFRLLSMRIFAAKVFRKRRKLNWYSFYFHLILCKNPSCVDYLNKFRIYLNFRCKKPQLFNAMFEMQFSIAQLNIMAQIN